MYMLSPLIRIGHGTIFKIDHRKLGEREERKGVMSRFRLARVRCDCRIPWGDFVLALNCERDL